MEIQTKNTQVGNESVVAHEQLQTKLVHIVSSRSAVPMGSKYIVIKDSIGMLRLPLAITLMMIELLVIQRFRPDSYTKTYISGGNLWYIFGRRCEWNDWAFSSKQDLYQILNWLHPKGLRYIVVINTSGENTVRKVVQNFNRDLNRVTQVDIIQERNKLRYL